MRVQNPIGPNMLKINTFFPQLTKLRDSVFQCFFFRIFEIGKKKSAPPTGIYKRNTFGYIFKDSTDEIYHTRFEYKK